MRVFTIALIVIVIAGLIVISQSFFIVDQTRQAIVLRLGEAQRVINPACSSATVRAIEAAEAAGETPSETCPEEDAGLKFKTPFVENAVIFEKRNLAAEVPDIEILANDQQRLVVDAFVRWRIDNPLNFYRRLNSEQNARLQIERFTESAIRENLGQASSRDIISEERSNLMNRIRDTVTDDVADSGIDIIDVRIRRADLPDENLAQAFVRMRTARREVADGIRAEGAEQARDIQSAAQAQAEEIRATASAERSRIRGTADAQRTEIFASAHGRDPEFYAFLRSMDAYRMSISDGTQIVLSPDSEFFEYFEDAGRGAPN